MYTHIDDALQQIQYISWIVGFAGPGDGFVGDGVVFVGSDLVAFHDSYDGSFVVDNVGIGISESFGIYKYHENLGK